MFSLENSFIKISFAVIMQIVCLGTAILGIVSIPGRSNQRGFIKASNFENMYHRHKNQTDNVKYYNKKTGQEIIFDANGKVVTDIENIGTYNYYSPGNAIDNILHIGADVLLYHIWGE